MASSVPFPSSVPAWNIEPAPVDSAARSVLLVGHGESGAAVAAGWQALLPRRVAVSVLLAQDLDAAFLQAFDERLAAAVIGWRLMLAGPEPAVALLRARAVQHGAEDAEIRVTVTSLARHRIYCAHCAGVYEANVAVSSRMTCPGCSRVLTVRPHFSARHGAYLGVADV